jgi:hypothetical protein
VVRDGHEYPWEPQGHLGGDQGTSVGYIAERRVFDRVLAEKASDVSKLPPQGKVWAGPASG